MRHYSTWHAAQAARARALEESASATTALPKPQQAQHEDPGPPCLVGPPCDTTVYEAQRSVAPALTIAKPVAALTFEQKPQQAQYEDHNPSYLWVPHSEITHIFQSATSSRGLLAAINAVSIPNADLMLPIYPHFVYFSIVENYAMQVRMQHAKGWKSGLPVREAMPLCESESEPWLEARKVVVEWQGEEGFKKGVEKVGRKFVRERVRMERKARGMGFWEALRFWA